MNRFANWLAGLAAAALVLTVVGGIVTLGFYGGPSSADIEADRVRRDAYEAEHAASPATWAKCRAVCGDSAALLPYGEFGRVTCSCLTPGAVVKGAR